jgi:hypothetical protein
VSLKQKFKDARRPLTNEESLKATKEKYGRKGVPKRLLADADSDSRESPRRKRSKVCAIYQPFLYQNFDIYSGSY